MRELETCCRNKIEHTDFKNIPNLWPYDHLLTLIMTVCNVMKEWGQLTTQSMDISTCGFNFIMLMRSGRDDTGWHEYILFFTNPSIVIPSHFVQKKDEIFNLLEKWLKWCIVSEWFLVHVFASNMIHWFNIHTQHNNNRRTEDPGCLFGFMLHLMTE